MKADAQRAALAEGFAQQIERWALAQGGDAAAARLAARAAQAASLATGDGHVCLPLDVPSACVQPGRTPRTKR